MWGWEFEYPNGKKVYSFFNSVVNLETNVYLRPEEVNDMFRAYIPEDTPIKVLCTSRDVITFLLCASSEGHRELRPRQDNSYVVLDKPTGRILGIL